MLVQALVPAILQRFRVDWLRSKPKLSAGIWGVLVGLAVGLTSVGSGSLITPFLMIMLPGKLSRVVGTDVFHAAVLVTCTSFLYVGAGQVEWRLVPLLLAGSLPGAMLGARLAARCPAPALRLGLGIVLLATGITLL
jgi:uncharacterized membrane protein YfcA